MGRIVVLPDTLCNQIAAGEVVERPAAVVKELMENSIDAASRKISVSMLQGGRKEIRVVDNGMGMSHDDALLALERHATSKIRRVEDLHSIQSLGFRGEALPSIASVSRFELITREHDAVSGAHIRMEAGVLRDVRETGCPPGTQILVRDIFFNLPARRKFLRSVDTETSHIAEQFLRLAMAHPDIHFQLINDDRYQYDFPSARNALTRAGQVLGMDVTTKLRPFAAERSSIKVHGLVSPPEIQRSSGYSLFVYVNGRPVWERSLNHAVLGAYDTLLPRGKFPMVVLFVELAPETVDVNVHPTKREVRFRSPGEVLELVRSTIRASLHGTSENYFPGESGRLPGSRDPQPFSRPAYTREAQIPMKDEPERPAHYSGSATPVQMDAFPGKSSTRAFSTPWQPDTGNRQFIPSILPRSSGASAPSPEHTPDGEAFFSRLPVLGQVANTFILLEAPDGLILIDQHAAHERIVFERLSSGAVREPAQRLARSVVLELMPAQAAVLRRRIEHLGELGFEIEPFGGSSFVIHSVPAALGNLAPDALIRDFIETSHEDVAAPPLEILAALAKSAACHSAIRAGQKLRPEEIRHLLEELDRSRIVSTCPHGRPWWHKLTTAEIARFFQRT